MYFCERQMARAQRQKSDCGIAAVAIATSKSYRFVRTVWKELFPNKSLRNGMSQEDILLLLEQVTGCPYQVRTASDWNRATTIKRFRFHRFPARGSIALLYNPLEYLNLCTVHAVAIFDGKFVDPGVDGGELSYSPDDRVVSVFFPAKVN